MLKNFSSEFLKNAAGFGIVFLLLILSVWKVSSGLEEQMDIRFYDESYYLTRGFFHPVSSWIADYSPLYSLWYKLEGLLFSDPVALYYANYRFWTFAFGLIIVFLLRLSGIRWENAAIWGILATASQLALPLWPKAGHLALLGTAAGIGGIQRWKDCPVSALSWVTGIGLLLSFCRPEFLSAAMGAGLILPVVILWKKKYPQLGSIIPFILGMVAVSIWGFPAGQSGRGMVAFGQHFVHNWRNISGQTQTDFMLDWVNWRPIVAQHFGKAANPVEAMLANPADMLLHLWFNFRYLIYNSLIYFSETIFPVRIFGLSPLYGLVFLIVSAEWLSGFKAGEGLLAKIRKKSWLHWLPWFFLALPSLLAGFLFQPRPHYILPLMAIFVFLAGRYFALVPVKINAKQRTVLLALALPLSFFLLPDTQAFFLLDKSNADNSENNFPDAESHFSTVTCTSLERMQLVASLRKYPFHQGFRIFDASTGASEYLGQRLVQCGKTGFEMNYDALADLEKFLDSAEVDGVFLHKTIHYDHFFTQNSFWQKLRSRPDGLGWKKVAIGSAGDSLILRKKIRF